MAGAAMRILVLEHDADAPAALLSAWADSRGHELNAVPGRRPATWPAPDDVDAIVSLGSDQSAVQSGVPWVAREIEFLATAHARRVPILGICFGGQTLAKALGGSVTRARSREVTWREVPSAERELITEGPWLFWHEDRFTLPPGARLLGGTPEQTAAFTSGASIGLQFHPEADTGRAEAWLEGARPKWASYGVDENQLRDEIDRYGPGAPVRAFDLFDRVARWWAAAPAPQLAGQPGLG
jgi:GMP synthase-like glutamine amidotransferase